MGKEGYGGPLERIDDCCWRIPKGYRDGMRVEGRIFADDRLMRQIRSDAAPEQVANVAFLPGIQMASLAMPDIHWGYGFCIGGVCADRSATGWGRLAGRRWLRHQLRSAVGRPRTSRTKTSSRSFRVSWSLVPENPRRCRRRRSVSLRTQGDAAIDGRGNGIPPAPRASHRIRHEADRGRRLPGGGRTGTGDAQSGRAGDATSAARLAPATIFWRSNGSTRWWTPRRHGSWAWKRAAFAS